MVSFLSLSHSLFFSPRDNVKWKNGNAGWFKPSKDAQRLLRDKKAKRQNYWMDPASGFQLPSFALKLICLRTPPHCTPFSSLTSPSIISVRSTSYIKKKKTSLPLRYYSSLPWDRGTSEVPGNLNYCSGQWARGIIIIILLKLKRFSLLYFPQN